MRLLRYFRHLTETKSKVKKNARKRAGGMETPEAEAGRRRRRALDAAAKIVRQRRSALGGLLVSAVLTLGRLIAEVRIVDGIRVTTLASSAKSRSSSLAAIEAALNELRRVDPVRWRRVIQNVRDIVVADNIGHNIAGRYFDNTKIIFVSTKRALEYPTAEVAGTIVHEATHAWFSRCKWGRRRDQARRSEEICSAYGDRLVQRLTLAGR